MKKRITGIATFPRKGRIKVKGWKVNPYIFIHKELNKNGNPVRHSSWTITHIPTGFRFCGDIKLQNQLTLKKLIELVDLWFPAWLVKEIKKKPNVTEEMKTRWRILKRQIEDKQTVMWEV